MPDIMIARRPGWVRIDGRRRMVKKGVTTAHADHPVVTDHPRLWQPLEVTYPSPAADLLEVTTLADPKPVTLALDDPEDPGDPEPDPDPEDPAAEPPAAPVGPGTGEPPPPSTGQTNADIRRWAADNGIEVSPRGKIPTAVVEQYEAAHR